MVIYQGRATDSDGDFWSSWGLLPRRRGKTRGTEERDRVKEQCLTGKAWTINRKVRIRRSYDFECTNVRRVPYRTRFLIRVANVRDPTSFRARGTVCCASGYQDRLFHEQTGRPPSRLNRVVTPRTICEGCGHADARSFLSVLVAFCQPPKRIAIFQRYPGSKMAGRVSAERQTPSSFLLHPTHALSLFFSLRLSLIRVLSASVTPSRWLPLCLAPRTRSIPLFFTRSLPFSQHMHACVHHISLSLSGSRF